MYQAGATPPRRRWPGRARGRGFRGLGRGFNPAFVRIFLACTATGATGSRRSPHQPRLLQVRAGWDGL